MNDIKLNADFLNMASRGLTDQEQAKEGEDLASNAGVKFYGETSRLKPYQISLLKFLEGHNGKITLPMSGKLFASKVQNQAARISGSHLSDLNKEDCDFVRGLVLEGHKIGVSVLINNIRQFSVTEFDRLNKHYSIVSFKFSDEMIV